MKTIDLTYWISPEGSKYPSDPLPEIDITPAFFDQGKLKSAVTNLKIRPHHGTHIDAPAHKLPEGLTIDKYCLDRFINDAVLINVFHTSDSRDRYCGHGYLYARRITYKAVEKAIKNDYNGQKAVLIRTGYERVIEQGVQDDVNFPCLEEDAAKYLADLGLNMLGIDSFSVDPKGSEKSPAHTALLEADCLIAETLVNPAKLQNCKAFRLYAIPIIIEGADAAPARVFAEVSV